MLISGEKHSSSPSQFLLNILSGGCISDESVSQQITMAAEVEAPQAMTYIPETILKKRKRNDELAILRRKQLELGKYGMKNKKQLQVVGDIKRPEQLIRQFREKMHSKFPRAYYATVESVRDRLIKVQEELKNTTKMVQRNIQKYVSIEVYNSPERALCCYWIACKIGTNFEDFKCSLLVVKQCSSAMMSRGKF